MDTIDDFLKEEFSQCCMCLGFYGLNFGQPICSTCHYFLFPTDINMSDDAVIEKADSEDSGNEEPALEEDFYVGNDAAANPASSAAPARAVMMPPKMDKLTERVAALTILRENDHIPQGVVDTLPPEVWLVVFRHLDDVSLWSVGNVCARWRQILESDSLLSQDRWHHFILQRWPLFNPQYNVTCWKQIYNKLIESAPCRLCLESMMLQTTLPIEENSWRRRRLRSELKTLRVDPPEGIQATPLDRHCCHWQASITGPQGSPYQGGIFFLYLQIPNSYPMKPPVVRFITRILHPNISRHGDIGLDSIHHNWSLALTISKVLISIQSLLTDPFCHVSMEPAVGRLYANHHAEFDRIARLWTWKYAMHDYLMPMDMALTSV